MAGVVMMISDTCRSRWCLVLCRSEQDGCAIHILCDSRSSYRWSLHVPSRIGTDTYFDVIFRQPWDRTGSGSYSSRDLRYSGGMSVSQEGLGKSRIVGRCFALSAISLDGSFFGSSRGVRSERTGILLRQIQNLTRCTENLIPLHDGTLVSNCGIYIQVLSSWDLRCLFEV